MVSLFDRCCHVYTQYSCVVLVFMMLIFLLSLYHFLYVLFCFFKQKTAYEMRISDWSSDVVLFRSLVARIVPAADLLEDALKTAATIAGMPPMAAMEIGRASCRERVCQYV